MAARRLVEMDCSSVAMQAITEFETTAHAAHEGEDSKSNGNLDTTYRKVGIAAGLGHGGYAYRKWGCVYW